jgi:HSP20 family molecular chaperone IbpA
MKNEIAKFAMNRIEFGLDCSELPLSAPPYEILMDSNGYSICFNMLGIPERGIRTMADAKEQRFTIFAEREKNDFTDQFLWVFSLPDTLDMKSVESFYSNGVVQFNFSQRRMAC